MTRKAELQKVACIALISAAFFIGAIPGPTDNSVTGENEIPTYSASANFNNSSAGDAYCVWGSATMVVRVRGIRITATASQQVVQNISVVRRSSVDSGGGATPITIVASDPTIDPASTATTDFYTSAPTPGTLIGNVRDRFITVSATSTNVVSVSEGLFQFSVYWEKPQIIRGTTQGICVKVPSTSGGSWSIDAEWSETPL